MENPETKFPGLLYSYHGKPIGTFYLEDRFSYGLQNAAIGTEGGILTPHSCRYTYDTKMRSVLPPDVLREFIGHRDQQMTITTTGQRFAPRLSLVSSNLLISGRRSSASGNSTYPRSAHHDCGHF